MKAVVYTLGCKVNDVESGSIIRGLETLGYEVSRELESADLYVVNTCAVTAEAERKSRQTVGKVIKCNPAAKVIVCGCASEKSPTDFDIVLCSLREFFFGESGTLTWDMVDYLENLPYYIETKDFICVHAGIPLDENKNLIPLNQVEEEYFLYDRRFKDSDVIHNSEKCVFYGHTVAENGKITSYKRKNAIGNNIKDFYKIHLDTGAWQNGVLGCFCLENCECIYVKKPN